MVGVPRAGCGRMSFVPPDPLLTSDFVRRLPKAELHVHHIGSVSPTIVAELAERHPGTVPSDLDELHGFFEFRDFAHFIQVYLAVSDLVRTAEDVRYLTYEVAREMAVEQTVRYAEMTCTPTTSVHPEMAGGRGEAPHGGIPIEAYTEAIEDARVAAERDFGIVLRWVYDISGSTGIVGADATLEIALNRGCDGLVGFGLGGREHGVPRSMFADHFARARASGLRSVPHAGETTGPEAVWDALRSLGAERIGHGTSAVQDPLLLEHLASTGIPLEVCPSSNVATRAVDSLQSHPLRQLVDAGVTVTIGSDDPPMFGTTISREYEIAADLLALDVEGVGGLARVGVRASFAPEHVKHDLLAAIDAHVSRARNG